MSEVWRASKDTFENFLIVPTIERCCIRKHLIQLASKSPPIGRIAVAILYFQQFWSQIFMCPHQLIKIVPILQSRCKAEVRQLNIAFLIHHYIFCFEISIEDLVFMEVLQRQNNIRSVEYCCTLLEVSDVLEVEK